MKKIEIAEGLVLPQNAAVQGAFWAKVDKDTGPVHPVLGRCWLWTGATDPNGYGRVSQRRHRTGLAHRAAYEMMIGPLGKRRACHRCDNPPCVRPSHLFPGTQLDNMRDCVAKGRLHPGLPPLGSKSKWAKLTEADVTEIRRLRATRVSLSVLGRRFNVTPQAIHNIEKGKSWRRHP